MSTHLEEYEDFGGIDKVLFRELIVQWATEVCRRALAMVELDNLLSAEELQALSAGFAKSNVRTVTVSIFDKEYQVSCKTD